MNLSELEKISGGPVFENEPMGRHTTFRVGGNADFFVIPRDMAHLLKLISFLNLNGLRYFLIGNGSNLLVSDRGVREIIISLGKDKGGDFSAMSFSESCGGIDVEVGAACLLRDVGKYLATIGAKGFEPLSGIPGSIGGACVMNAGAYGVEMKDLITGCEVVDGLTNIRCLKRDELGLRYRGSGLMDHGLIVTRVFMHLKRGDPGKIQTLNSMYLSLRKAKQPLDYASAGSTFKRPEGFFAGKLISDAGLKGYTIGGAKVSEKHAGFIINTGDATATDIYRLINYCKETVFDRFGVMLEPEVRFLGDF